MRRSTWVVIGIVALVGTIAAAAAVPRFLPERSLALSEDGPQAATVLGSATWSGRAGHSASGSVTLLTNESGAWVRFEDFEMTAGPAVYLYLSSVAEPDSRDEIRGSWRLAIAGGAEGGELTKRGDFNQRLPDGFAVENVRGFGAWCEDFAVPFGVAPVQ